MAITVRLDMTGSSPRGYGGYGSVFVLLMVLLCGFVTPVAAQDEAPLGAAKSFLELLDVQNYQQAWWEGSELLHRTSTLDRWVDEVSARRELMGAVAERLPRSSFERASQPGFPDGDYVLLTFNTRFEYKQSGFEVLTLRKGLYGQWRVLHYRLI